jgi:hypothetical protein
LANGLTSATKEDGAIQARRWNRAPTKREKECVGWSIGRGYEADYLEAIQVSDGLRYRNWLRYFAPQHR